MPRDGGTGVFSKPSGTTAVSNTNIESAKYNQVIDDFVTDANTARPVVAGGTGATTAAGARSNLGIAIGTNVQAYDAGLQSIAGLTTAADQTIYTTASDTYAVSTLTSYARTLLDDADAATARTTLELGNAATGNFAGPTAAAEGTSGATIMSPAGVSIAIDAKTIGADQTWQDVSGSRTIGATSQNNTDRPIMVAVDAGEGARLEVSTNSTTWVVIQNNINFGVQAIIPPGHYYRVIGGAIEVWAELR